MSHMTSRTYSPALKMGARSGAIYHSGMSLQFQDGISGIITQCLHLIASGPEFGTVSPQAWIAVCHVYDSLALYMLHSPSPFGPVLPISYQEAYQHTRVHPPNVEPTQSSSMA